MDVPSNDFIAKEDHRSGSINDDDEPVMVLPDDRP